MQQQPVSPELHIQCDSVDDMRARELRQHPAARDVGFGWLRIAQQEYFPDRVLLVSNPKLLMFEHVSSYAISSAWASVIVCRVAYRQR